MIFEKVKRRVLRVEIGTCKSRSLHNSEHFSSKSCTETQITSLTVILVTEECVVSGEVGAAVEEGTLLDEHFPDIVQAVDDDTLNRS